MIPTGTVPVERPAVPAEALARQLERRASTVHLAAWLRSVISKASGPSAAAVPARA